MEKNTRENILKSKEIKNQVENWILKHSNNRISFYCIVLPGIPLKIAGVGYARKIAMDEAVRRFVQAGQEDGIIVSFDADTSCDRDYLINIESHFLQNSQTDGCTIYFEHPTEGSEFPRIIYQGITQYELHLRYYLHSLRNTGFPNAFYTVGSAFAVRARTYCRQGGMNTRKAGEDFYFLQKLFDLGSFTELNSTRIIPSPRVSSRVPFGTGAAIEKFLKTNDIITSFNPKSFDSLQKLFENLPLLYKAENEDLDLIIEEFDELLQSCLRIIDFKKSLEEIKNNSSSYEYFRKRFYRYFNMFRILKFLNYAKRYHPDLPVIECSAIFLHKKAYTENRSQDAKSLLEIFRKLDRTFNPQQI